MDLFKLDKYDKYFIAFILVVITLFNIGQCFATEVEDVDYNIVDNILASSNSNYFIANTSARVVYFEVEKGYLYHIVNNYGTTYMNVVLPSSVPALNVTYETLTNIGPGESYDYLATTNGTLVASNIAKNTNNFTITREQVLGQTSAVNDLVQNVGFNQLWGVFENGIDFVGVIVLVAFGLFLVFLLIKKLSKGKSDY